MAETRRFELPIGFDPYNGLANRRLQPLGHVSARRLERYTIVIAVIIKASILRQLEWRIDIISIMFNGVKKKGPASVTEGPLKLSI